MLSPSKARCSALARSTRSATRISVPFTTTGSAYTSRKAASASSREPAGCVHSGKSRSSRVITALVCIDNPSTTKLVRDNFRSCRRPGEAVKMGSAETIRACGREPVFQDRV